jgi:GMP synthase (glutamine-hydrolysing)
MCCSRGVDESEHMWTKLGCLCTLEDAYHDVGDVRGLCVIKLSRQVIIKGCHDIRCHSRHRVSTTTSTEQDELDDGYVNERRAPGDDVEAGCLESATGERAEAGGAREAGFARRCGAMVGARPGSVVILDFGSQYTTLVARRIRECGVDAEVMPGTASAANVNQMQPGAIVLSGGPGAPADGALKFDSGILDLGTPVLGICYGMQLMAQVLGGDVGSSGRGEYGRTRVEVVKPSVLLAGMPRYQAVWMSHSNVVTSAPPGFEVTVYTGDRVIAVIEAPSKRMFGVMFHPEVSHADLGLDLIQRFLYGICGLRRRSITDDFITSAVTGIRSLVGSEPAICAVSGGIDSVVTAVLGRRALGDRMRCFLVETGLLRHQEANSVIAILAKELDLGVTVLDRRDEFMSELKGVRDPDAKRRIIGREFIRAFEDAAHQTLGRCDVFLLQGTIRSDVIETGSGPSARIKRHHNVGALPDGIKLRLVEPLRDVFKDEVRRVAHVLGVPQSIIRRQPFPGPGLAIRIIGEVTSRSVATLRSADRVVCEEMNEAGIVSSELWGYFAVLLADVTISRDVGQLRTYPIVIRAVSSEDSMTADWARLPYTLLDRISTRILTEVPGVGRVVYDITSKPPGTIDWE